MEKEMPQISVYTTDGGDVCISQMDDCHDYYYQETIIMITEEQIDTVIKWLQEAKEEISKAEK